MDTRVQNLTQRSLRRTDAKGRDFALLEKSIIALAQGEPVSLSHHQFDDERFALLAYGLSLLSEEVQALRSAQRTCEAVHRHVGEDLSSAAMLSHEVRAPIHSVLSAASMLRTVTDATKRQQLHSMIDQAGDVVMQTLERSLQNARQETPEQSAEPAVDWVNLVESTVAPSRIEARRRELAFVLDCQETVSSQSIRTDGLLVAQILRNLVDNALAYTPSGSVMVTGRVESTSEGSANLVLAVADTGVGMPAAIRDEIMKPFFSSTSDKQRTHGLGLAVVDHNLRLLNGRLNVSSEPGEGTTMTVTIPVQLDMV